MEEREYTGYILTAPHEESALGNNPRGYLTRVEQGVEFYKIFTSKTVAEIEASDHKFSIEEVKIIPRT